MVVLKQGELAELAGITDRHLRRINNEQEEGRKLLVKTEGGYDACTFVQRWCEYQVQKATEGIDDLDAVKARHEIVKTEKTELEVARMRGKLLDFQDVKKAWGDIANTVTNAMLNVPAQVAPLIRGMESVEAIRNLIDGEIRRGLEAVAETPLPAYAAEAEETEEQTPGES